MYLYVHCFLEKKQSQKKKMPKGFKNTRGVISYLLVKGKLSQFSMHV